MEIVPTRKGLAGCAKPGNKLHTIDAGKRNVNREECQSRTDARQEGFSLFSRYYSAPTSCCMIFVSSKIKLPEARQEDGVYYRWGAARSALLLPNNLAGEFYRCFYGLNSLKNVHRSIGI